MVTAMKRTFIRMLLRGLGGLLFGTLFAVLLLAFAVWLQLRPVAGEWIAAVPLSSGESAPRVRLSMPRLIQAATDPRFARWLDGRHVATPIGTVHLQWQPEARTLVARCAPCRLRLAALGDRPLPLRSGELVVRRDGEWRLHGHVASGAVVLPWQGRLSPIGLQLDGELAPTGIASVYALVGEAIPELQRARIAGHVSATWQWRLPVGGGSVMPRLEGFTVDGLGTDALLNAALPARCASGRAPSPWLARALIAAEDSRFHEHPGYDLAGLLASFDMNQRGGGVRAGASTLTQQLAKRLYTGDERSALRKMRELLYTVEMERTLGKGRILQLYLGLAPWAPGVCGAEAAARHHLAKPAARVDPLEAAWLVSLLPHPMATPPPVDRARMAVILNGMTGAGARQHARWMRVLPEWQPPGRAFPPAPNRPTMADANRLRHGARHASTAPSPTPDASSSGRPARPVAGSDAEPDAGRLRQPAAAAG